MEFFEIMAQIINNRDQFYNGMLRHSLGGAVICISLQYFIAPALDLMPALWGSCSLPPGLGGLVSLYSLFAISNNTSPICNVWLGCSRA